MRTENVVAVLAVACAFVLLFAPFTGRTTWVSADPRETGGTGGIRHSAGWDYVAPMCGLIAIAGVVAGWFARPRVVIPLAGAIAAAIAFTVIAVAAAGHWLDGITGRLDLRGFTTHPAPGAPFFAVVAILGAGYAIALAIGWLRSE